MIAEEMNQMLTPNSVFGNNENQANLQSVQYLKEDQRQQDQPMMQQTFSAFSVLP